MLIAIGGISHETNTFSPVPTGLEDFVNAGAFPGLLEGEDIIEHFRGTKTIIGGIIDAAPELDLELVPLIWTFATPSGTVDHDAYEMLKRRLTNALESAGWVEGIIMDLHGAMVTTECEDAEGDLLAAVRYVFGRGVPCVTTLDLHANITAAMVNHSDVLVGFDTYPHIDMYERGQEAARLVASLLNEGWKATAACVQLPLITAPPKQCTLFDPMQAIFEKAREIEQREGVVNVTVAGGFPFADIWEAGTSVVVTTQDDDGLARELAEELAEFVWARRDEFEPELLSVEEAVREAIALTLTPNPSPACDGVTESSGLAGGRGKQELVSSSLARDKDQPSRAPASGRDEYESVPPSPAHDTEQSSQTIASGRGEYNSTPPSPAHDAEQPSRAPASGRDEYNSTPPSPAHDAEQSSQTIVSGRDEYNSTPPSPAHDAEQSSHTIASGRGVGGEGRAGPVLLADTADNPGGGGACDGTAILAELLNQNARDAVVAVIADPDSVASCVSAGVGASVELLIGGKSQRSGDPDLSGTDDHHGAPVEVTATVINLTDGTFVTEGPMGTGVKQNMGRTAVVKVNGVEIVLTERRIQARDTALLRSVGIEPTQRKIIALKSSVHFRAAFQPIASRIIEVDGPGCHSPNLTRYQYAKLRKPMYPLQLGATWEDRKMAYSL